MKKYNHFEVEEKVRRMFSEPYQPSQQRIEEVKQRVFEEYKRQSDSEGQKTTKKRKGLLRRMVVIVAATVSLFILSFGYLAFAPNGIANAREFVKRATIWINNQFRLGINIYTPMEEPKKTSFIDGPSYTTLQEAYQKIHMPFVYLPETDSLRIESIDLTEPEQNETMIRILYTSSSNETFSISTKASYDSISVGINDSQSKEIDLPFGKLFIWARSDYYVGIGFFDDATFTIISSLPKEEFEACCNSLEILN